MKISRAAEQVRSSIIHPRAEIPAHPGGPALSTGSTLLNLALTDTPDAGFLAGKYFFVVGDSVSGKTFLSMTCLAEATRNPSFDGYKLIYDNVEDGMLMDVERLFGRATALRLRPPAGTQAEPKFSETVQEFYYHLDDLIQRGKPFIYVLDSMDGLSSEEEGSKFREQKKAYRAGREVPGSYGDAKAKRNSAGLRQVLQGLRDTGSILVITCQTRDALNAVAWGPRKTRSGGHALRFYATCEIWSSVAGGISRKVHGKTRKVGSTIQLKITKNRITGKQHTIELPIYPSYGIDDVGASIDFLLEEKHWAKRGGKIAAKELGVDGFREEITRLCEREKRAELVRAVTECWKEIQSECSLERDPRYT